MTSASLLASSTRLPARAAASVEASPAAPTIAAITTSQRRSTAIFSSAAAPKRSSVPCSRKVSASRALGAAPESTA